MSLWDAKERAEVDACMRRIDREKRRDLLKTIGVVLGFVTGGLLFLLVVIYLVVLVVRTAWGD